MSFIFSLTSYPARFPYLNQVIDSLRKQDIRAEGIVLNIANEDKDQLKLNSYDDVHINYVENLKAAKKLLPTIINSPDKNIITIDDDTIYPKDLSEKLLQGMDQNPGSIITGRARKIVRDSSGNFETYMKWPLLFEGHHRAPNVMPTGVGGVLYPPGVFHEDVFDYEFLNNFLTNDDYWWYAQARRNNTNFVQVPIFEEKKFPNISPIANKGLFYYGNKTKNDEVFKLLLDKYGNFTGI